MPRSDGLDATTWVALANLLGPLFARLVLDIDRLYQEYDPTGEGTETADIVYQTVKQIDAAHAGDWTGPERQAAVFAAVRGRFTSDAEANRVIELSYAAFLRDRAVSL